MIARGPPFLTANCCRRVPVEAAVGGFDSQVQVRICSNEIQEIRTPCDILSLLLFFEFCARIRTAPTLLQARPDDNTQL
jgi:hypothetical protein